MHDSKPTVIFRVDASLQIGSGHVMRCLTLADALRESGAVCHFICREHRGHMLETIQARGFGVYPLRMRSDIGNGAPQAPAGPKHSAWLGCSWEEDAADCRDILQDTVADWIVVDHYALDFRWERLVRPFTKRLLVIDDLADRSHVADLLLDQSLGRSLEDYARLVPAHCVRLVGPNYALLRPEFARLRESSLARRKAPQLQELLISMGGVDRDNTTGRILAALLDCILPPDFRINVVMGGSAPWLEQVRAQAAAMPWVTEVFIDIDNIAEKMVAADVSIGAAGSTSWERCCLGLPTMIVVLADNQRAVADALDVIGAAANLGTPDALAVLPERWPALTQEKSLRSMSQRSAQVTAGFGTNLVIQAMQEES